MAYIPFFLFLALGFLVGAIPFAYLFVRRLKGIDIRQVGSGNVGATNASRILGRPLGILVLLLDMAKGVLAAWLLPLLLGWLYDWGVPAPLGLYQKIMTVQGLGLCLGIAAFLGHCFNPFLRFRGGKGVATALGVYLVVAWQATLLTAVVCVAIILATRIVSIASITGAILLPVSIVAFDLMTHQPVQPFVVAVTVLIASMVIFRHRANIRRLLAGKEHRA